MTIIQKDRLRNLVRYCVVYEKKLAIVVRADKTYTGGHFFGKLNLEKNKKAEYWECDSCYKN